MLFILFIHKAQVNSQEWIKYAECDAGQVAIQLKLDLSFYFYYFVIKLVINLLEMYMHIKTHH